MSSVKSHGFRPLYYRHLFHEVSLCVFSGLCVLYLLSLAVFGACPVWTISCVALVASCVDDLAPEVLLLLGGCVMLYWAIAQ